MEIETRKALRQWFDAILDQQFETTVGKREGEPTTFTATLGEFPPVAIEKFLRYGFQRVFNDSCGGADKTLETKVDLVREMMDEFKAGQIGKARAPSVEPIVHETRLMAGWFVRNTAKNGETKAAREAAKKLWKDLKALEWDKRAPHLDAIAAKNPQIGEKAAAELARKQAAAKESVSVNLDGISLS